MARARRSRADGVSPRACGQPRRLLAWAPLALVAAGFGGLVGSLAILSPLLALPGLAAYAVAFSAVTASALAAGSVAPVARTPGLVLSLGLSIAGLAVASALGARQGDPVAAALVTASLLAGAAALGAAVGGRIEHPGHLLVVAVVSLLVDVFSVFHVHGPAAAVVARPEALALVALPFPVLGTELVAPVLGAGDAVFAALYLSASRRHGLGVGRTAAALGAGLLLTGLAVALAGIAVPALPAMGAAVVLAHPRARRLAERDRRTAWIAMAGAAGLWLASWLIR